MQPRASLPCWRLHTVPVPWGSDNQGTGVITLPIMHGIGHCSSHLTAAAVHACLLMWLLLQAEVVLVVMPKSQQREDSDFMHWGLRLIAVEAADCSPEGLKGQRQRGHTLLLP